MGGEAGIRLLVCGGQSARPLDLHRHAAAGTLARQEGVGVVTMTDLTKMAERVEADRRAASRTAAFALILGSFAVGLWTRDGDGWSLFVGLGSLLMAGLIIASQIALTIDRMNTAILRAMDATTKEDTSNG